MSIFNVKLLALGRSGTVVNNREEFQELRRRQDHLKYLHQVRNLNGKEAVDEAKRRLSAFIYGAVPNPDGTFKGVKDHTDKLKMDIDHVPDEKMPLLKQRIMELKEELGILFAERSASCHGVHIVFTGNSELSIEGNLQWVTDKIGIEGVVYDKAVKDPARLFFATSNEPDDLWILDDKLFEDDKVVEYPEATAAKPQVYRAECISEPATGSKDFPKEYHGTPYTLIVKELEKVYGKPQVGDRNNTYFKMAKNMASICDRNVEWVYGLLPDYGLSSEERRSTVKSACSYLPTGDLPQELQTAIKNANVKDDCPPAMPEKLPPLIELLVSKTPDNLKPAAAHAVFAPLASHLNGVKFRYIDNRLKEPSLMCVLMAATRTGKSCIDDPIKYIMEDITQNDEQLRVIEEEWKKNQRGKSAREGKDTRPICPIQYVSPNMTDAAFRERMAQASGKFLYTYIPEIEFFLAKGQDRIPFFEVVRCAFDNAKYGAERKSIESSSEMVEIRWNWNASTTPGVGRSFFAKQSINGVLNRLNFCTIPESPIGSPIPVYGIYDDEFRNNLKPYIDRLNAACGEGTIKSEEIQTFTKELCNELANEAKKIAVNSSVVNAEVYEDFSFRANVIAFLKAYVLYIAEGRGELTQEFKDFIRWSLHYDIWCKLHFFGEDVRIAKEKDKALTVTPSRNKGKQSVLDEMPDVFTKDELAKVLAEKGIATSAAENIKSWKRSDRAKIEPVEGKTDTYRKVS